MFEKYGELLEVAPGSVQSVDSVVAEMGTDYINAKFAKFATELRRVAPKANDFLYFSAIMMHAAEASTINSDGSLKRTAGGEPLQVSWDISSNGSWKWVSNDPYVKAYKNANGDIFPESELLLAYKKWVGKPLAIDHKADSVDCIRGIILDTHYDRLNKRVIALCALDKVSYPELARGVSSGYKTSVSMGTRVAHAICYDCGQVAATERDFCQHMRNKSSYGEINTGLDPIELSIVVSGADPLAKIRTILASANTLRASLEEKETALSVLAESSSSTSKFQELQDDLNKISEKLADLKADLAEDTNKASDTAPYGQHGSLAMKESELPASETNFNLPAHFASNNNALRGELQELKACVKGIEHGLTTLSSKIKEELMSVNSNHGSKKEGYFQGAGGANEPAPHQVKYPKDPLNEQLREHGDKQMLDTATNGPIDGLFPGDKEKKELLLRAEVEERAIRRAAALHKAKENLMKSKEAYFQGGGEGNEPTPGKPKYPKDPLNEKDRNKEDKQMVGQKPFPGVGDVDGLHPSPESADQKDELARKKLLQRASLKARFVRVANEDGTQNLADSAWQVSKDDGEVLFTATVEEIAGGKVDALYDTVASKDFGTKLLSKVHKLGTKAAAKLYKGAQAVADLGSNPAAAGGAAPVPPMPDMGAAPGADFAGGMADSAPPGDAGADGDPKESALALAEETRDKASDLLEAVRTLTGEQSEMGDLEGLTEKAASDDLKKLFKMKKTINASLIAGMKKAASELNEYHEELSLIADVLEEGGNTDKVSNLVDSAFIDAKAALNDARGLMRSFITYSNGSDQLRKQAQMLADQMHVEDEALAEDCAMVEDTNDAMEVLSDDDMSMASDEDKTEEDEDMNDVMMDVDPNSLQGKKVEIKASLETKEARAEFRAKLAAQAVQFSPMLDQAHALADGQTQLDVKPSDSLGKVETINEKHKAMLDVAEAPVKVRKEAARLNDLIKAGKVSKDQLDTLVSQGLDAEVVKYWKSFYGEMGKEGSEFASELLKEHAKAQIDEEISRFKVKIARAYELTNEMVRRGMLADERTAITAHVDDVLTWNDEGFDAMKRVVNKTAMRKSASIPQVGVFGMNDTAQKTETLQDALDQVFSNRRY